MTTVQLDASDAAELTEMLTFISDWLNHDPVQLEELLLNFAGNGSYDLDTLHADSPGSASCSATTAPACSGLAAMTARDRPGRSARYHPGQRVLSLRSEGAHQIGCGRQVVDEINGLAGPHRRREIASRHAILIRPPGIGVPGQFVFAAPPLIEKRVAEGAGRVFRRPPGTPGDVKHRAALGVLPASLDDRLADRGIDKCLGRGLKTSPDQRPGGTQSQGRCHAPPIGDPARGQHRRRGSQIHHDRHERQRRPPAQGAMPTAFGPLRHDDISAEVHRLPGLLKVGDLDNQRRTSLPDWPDERPGITEGQHLRPGVLPQRRLDRADIDRPALETDAPRLVSAFRDDRQLAGQPVQIPVAAAQQSQTPPLETAAASAPPAQQDAATRRTP
jgi:hypothetical protein